jgi:hypothetical protein
MIILWFLMLSMELAAADLPKEPILPVRVTAGVHAVQSAMDFYDSSVPLIYEMEIPDTQQLQAYMVIPPNPKLRGLTTLNAILDETKHLLRFASFAFTSFPASERSKRSLDFISDFYSFCCGFATGRSVDQLVAHENSLDEFTSKVKSQLDTEHQYLIQEAAVYNGFQARVEKALNKSTSTFSSITSELVESEKEIEGQVISIMQGMIQVATMLHHSTTTTTRVQAVSDCRNHLIPSSVVLPASLQTDLKGLATSLENVGRSLTYPINNLDRYFKEPIASCLISNSKIIVTVKVPTRMTADVHKLYQVTPLPFIYEGSACQVSLQVGYALTVNDAVIPLTSQLSDRCDPTQSSLCLVPRYAPFNFYSSACIRALLMSQSSSADLNRVCPLTCMRQATKQTLIQQLNGYRFIVVNPFGPLTVQCKAKEPRTIIYNARIGHIDITLQCFCAAIFRTHQSSFNVTLTPDFPCLSKSQPMEAFHHTIPTHFTTLQNTIITGSTLYQELDGILNTKWPLTVGHQNLSAP